MPSDSLNLLFTPAISAFIIAVCTTPIIIKLYQKFNLLDDPKKNKHIKVVHSKPVPRGGGTPIFLSLCIVGLVLFQLDKHFLGILFGALILTIIGILDDIYNLHPYLRLVTGTFAALCVVAVGIGIAYITNPFGEPGSVINLSNPQIPLEVLGKTRTIWVLADLFALIWILWFMNIVNWSKGVDGQMPGFVAIAAVFLGLLSLRFIGDPTQWEVIQLAGITAGSFLGLLFWNRYPQKIMPGYGGGSLAGFLLAILSILSGAKVAALILLLGVPVIDAVYTIIRRLIQGKSPVWGDRGHLHHRLLDAGLSKSQIAYFYWGITLILGVVTLQLNSNQKIFALIMLTVILSTVILWLQKLSKGIKSTNDK